MADLIVIAFDSEADAEAAYDEIQVLQNDLVVELAGLALVKVDDEGKTKVEYPGVVGKVGAGAAGGALFGALIGILFFVPIAGLVFGGLFGALFAGLDKTNLDAEFRDRVKSAVSAGNRRSCSMPPRSRRTSSHRRSPVTTAPSCRPRSRRRTSGS